jgi:UV DNA damage repair endonuclease
MRTGIPLQQKIHVDEHEKRKKEKEKHEKYLDSEFFMNALYIRLFR